MNAYHNIDCMEGMKEFPDKYFELAIVDPPYGLDITKGFDVTKDSRPKHKKAVENGYRKYEVKEWDNFIPDKNYFTELFRVSQNQIIWGGNYFVEYLHKSKGWIFWDKGADYEASFNFSHGELAFTSFEKRLMKYQVSPKSETSGGLLKIHPTQKPVKLYEWLLTNYAKQGDKILDTHVGSGSSIIAFEKHGFDYVGYEIDNDYYEASTKRILKHRELLQQEKIAYD